MVCDLFLSFRDLEPARLCKLSTDRFLIRIYQRVIEIMRVCINRPMFRMILENWLKFMRCSLIDFQQIVARQHLSDTEAFLHHISDRASQERSDAYRKYSYSGSTPKRNNKTLLYADRGKVYQEFTRNNREIFIFRATN